MDIWTWESVGKNRENYQHIKLSVDQLMRKHLVIDLGIGNLPAWYILFQERANPYESTRNFQSLITYPNAWNFTQVRNQS
jgi:hypothetical protein